MRPTIILQAALLTATLLGGVAALAQAPASPPPPASTSSSPVTRDDPVQRDSRNQRIEHIRVEDAGSRVDETRVGGQTQSITVQPKVGTMPQYEVQSNDGARAARNRDNNSGDTTGTRVWNFLKF